MNQSLPDGQRYVSEFVWLPTYAMVVAVVLGTVQDSTAATVVIFIALIGCRALLELLYRFVFGKARLNLSTGLAAFGCQTLVWGIVFWLLPPA